MQQPFQNDTSVDPKQHISDPILEQLEKAQSYPSVALTEQDRILHIKILTCKYAHQERFLQRCSDIFERQEAIHTSYATALTTNSKPPTTTRKSQQDVARAFDIKKQTRKRL